MNILIGTFLIGGMALWMAVQLGSPARRNEALKGALNTLAFTLPRVVVALIGAGLFAELLPTEQVEALFGENAGWKAIVLAAVLGPLTPGGAFVSFALAAAAMKAGAAVPPMLAYVTGWALFSVTKLLAYEWPIMGARALGLRLALSWPIPLILGGIATLIY